MKISIALGTFNGAKFLAPQLESFLAQTRLPDELIVCDDGSTDQTLRILNDFKKRAPFCVEIHQNAENLGAIKNFEKAIALCTGEIIFLADQDDVWLPEKVHAIAEEFGARHDLALVFTNAELVGENLEPLNLCLADVAFDKKTFEKLKGGKSSDIFFRCNVVTGATLAFRASFRRRIMPFPVHIAEMLHDAWIGLALALVAKYKFIEKPLLKYRVHELQQTGIRGFLAARESGIRRLKHYFYRREAEIIRRRKIIEWIESENNLLVPADKLKDLTGSAAIDRTGAARHSRFRANLPASLNARAVPIFKELMAGRYHKFSDGFLSAARDLLTGGLK